MLFKKHSRLQGSATTLVTWWWANLESLGVTLVKLELTFPRNVPTLGRSPFCRGSTTLSTSTVVTDLAALLH